MKKADNRSGYYGWTAERIQARVKMFGLGAGDHLRVKRLQETVICPNTGRIVGEFYRFLGTQGDFKRIMARGYSLPRLKATQTSYLHTLGVGFDSLGYFAERTRIGFAHARAQVPLNLYQAAYNLLQRLILASLPNTQHPDPNECAEFTQLVMKLTALDMSLAVETYHNSEVNFLEESLLNLRAETGEMQRQLGQDSLTGLENKSSILARVEDELADAVRESSPLCLIMADLDHFKDVNDHHGHLVGDGVLRDVAARMRAAARGADTIGRYGGEEFIIVMANTPLNSAKKIAERIRRHVMQTPIKVNRMEISMSVSLGLTQAARGDDGKTLIGRADAALYDAKNAGRNRVAIRHPPTEAAARPTRTRVRRRSIRKKSSK